jgi:hypothetical protein
MIVIHINRIYILIFNIRIYIYIYIYIFRFECHPDGRLYAESTESKWGRGHRG